MVQQYLRAFSLIAKNAEGNGIELQDFSVKFGVRHHTYTYPHTADIRILNLKSETQTLFVKEFTQLQILAGYTGNFGLIFQGTIKQVRTGWENTDSFTEIFAADGDQWYNFGVVHATLPAGYTQEHVWQTITNTVAPYNKTAPLSTLPKQTQSPRGKVLYGPVHDVVQDWADTNQQLVTTDNGILTAMPLLAFKPGDTMVINNQTGMVGAPEQTAGGISVTCLLNPALQWGSRIQLNNADITQNLVGNTELTRQTVLASQHGEKVATAQPIPDLSADGIYKVLTVDHVGETRGNAWYSRVICIASDPTTPAGKAAASALAGKLNVPLLP